MATPIVWTQADVDTLKSAIAKGTLSVSYSGAAGTRSVTYQSLAEMRSLLAEMVRQVNGGGTTYRRASFSKGF